MFTRTLLLLFLFWRQDIVCSVRLIEVRAPAYVSEGDGAILGCQYDLEGDQLYSIKWYKGNDEFFRYVPKQHPSIIAFKKPGINVNITRSSSTIVVLENLTRESEGYYICEVSGEAPNFTTARNSMYISMYYLPKSGPHVTGVKEQYSLDELAVINCTSSASRPRATLSWTVNDQPAAQQDLQGPWVGHSAERSDAVETTLQLRFIVAPRHFVNGAMKLKCRAVIPPLYDSETNSTHYIALPFTISADPPIVQDSSSSSRVLGSKERIFLLSVLLTLLQIVM